MSYLPKASSFLLLPLLMTVVVGCQQPIAEEANPVTTTDQTAEASPEPTTDNPEESTPVTAPEDTSSPEKTTPKPSEQAGVSLATGRYCYTLDDGILDKGLRLTVDQNGQIMGDAQATIQNDEAGYYTSYSQQFSGALTNDQAAVDITTWIEYDVQESQETWMLTNAQLKMENNVLELTDCQAVNPRFQNEDGLEGRKLLDGATAVHTQRVEFSPGTSSATVSNGVVRGERDVYLLGADGGQQMTLAITALEDNATFDVVSPSGFILALDATEETILLPQVGDYQVIVGGTRGNASYELTMRID